MPRLWGGFRTEGLEDEGEDLCDGRAVKSSFIVVEDVQVRHTHIVVDYCEYRSLKVNML